tara:strand:+ start:1130 stop:1963 length:834 start_codon:yes stop_codon:yes gene_type:complete
MGYKPITAKVKLQKPTPAKNDAKFMTSSYGGRSGGSTPKHKAVENSGIRTNEPQEKSAWNKGGHLALDVLGLIPGFGEIADGANAAWYTAEGDYFNAGLSTAAMVPFAGWAATATKLGTKGYSKASKVAKGVDKLSKAGFTPGKKTFGSKAPKVTVNTVTGISQPTKLGKYNRMATPVVDYIFPDSDSDKPADSKKQVLDSKNKNIKEPAVLRNQSTNRVSQGNSKWSKAVKSNASLGGRLKLSEYVKKRNAAKKGSSEYASAQNAINEAYGSKKRY